MAFQMQLVLSATAQRLSDLYGDGVGVVDAKDNVPFTQLYLQSSGAAAYLGGPSVSTTNYGVKLDTDGAPFGLSGGQRNIKLAELYAVGAGATLHLLGVQF
jgi:hypothetical protein